MALYRLLTASTREAEISLVKWMGEASSGMCKAGDPGVVGETAEAGGAGGTGGVDGFCL